ncbi:MAG: phosphatase PAP2 family protein [Prevotellaceae bacterium]|jgi:membrane-associated phospholipid phosphatase|nr:phosphatase PAP2 family protein [Prevotellaceae bacterium]
MALDCFFQRVETRKGVFAVEKVALLYNLLTTLLILFLYQEMAHPGHMLVERALIAAVTLLLVALYRWMPYRIVALVRIVVQMSLLSYWYPDTFEFNRVFPNLDHLFAAAEQWLFGTQPAVWFYIRFPQLWLSELLNMGYFFYYPMILVVMVWYFFRRNEWFEKVAFVLAASFFIYYFIYIFVPVAGPQFYFPAIGAYNVAHGTFPGIGDYFNHHQLLLNGPTGHLEGFFYNLVEASQRVGERPTAAFPSSHVGISTILMLLAWRGSKWLFAGLFPFYLLLCLATVYIQAHYTIDAIMGFFSGFILYIIVTWMYKQWFSNPHA